MKLLPKKRRKGQALLSQEMYNELYKRLSSLCIGWQKTCAVWMNKKASCLSKKTLIVLLGIFISLFGTYSLLLIIDGFSGKIVPAFELASIHIPHITLKPSGTESYSQSNSIESEYQKILFLQRYMYSLEKEPGGKIVYDSILLMDSRLIDSIQLIEKYIGSGNELRIKK